MKTNIDWIENKNETVIINKAAEPVKIQEVVKEPELKTISLNKEEVTFLVSILAVVAPQKGWGIIQKLRE